MKFDVIIGNPPYQETLKGGKKFNASALYHLFISMAKNLNPKYISMIIPSRWMTGVAKGIPKEWVQDFMHDPRLSIIHDFEDYTVIFNTVGVSGGICYFLWNNDFRQTEEAKITEQTDKQKITSKTKYYFHSQRGETFSRLGKLDYYDINTVIRNPKMYSIIDKIISKEGQAYYVNFKDNFSKLVSAKGIFTNGELLATNWKGYSLEKNEENNIKYYMSPLYNNNLPYAWVGNYHITKNIEAVDKHKIFISAAYGDPIRYDTVINVPFYGEPGSVCSQTYIAIGHKENFTKEECINIISYMNTKFFRFLVRAKKTTQDAARGAYQFVPLQDFSKPWLTGELYEKYGLTKEEIDYIEITIPNLEK